VGLIWPKPSTSGGTGRLPPRDPLPHKWFDCLNDSGDSGKSITHCECAFHSFSTGQLKSKLRYAELRIRVLEERLRLMRIEKYGAGGETLSQVQMQLFELEPVVSEMPEQAEIEHAPVHRSTKKSVKHPGRQELPTNLPRVERALPCYAGSAGVQTLRQRNRGDRLRREFSTGRGAREVFRAGHEAREASLPHLIDDPWRQGR
jgi:hypothetical protein